MLVMNHRELKNILKGRSIKTRAFGTRWYWAITGPRGQREKKMLLVRASSFLVEKKTRAVALSVRLALDLKGDYKVTGNEERTQLPFYSGNPFKNE